MSASALSPEVVSSIQRILTVEEPKESIEVLSDFTPIDTLNSLFPDEESLSQLEEVQKNLVEEQEKIQAEINALRKELQKDQDPGRMQLIQELISELLSQMNRIREKATESEAIVQNITREIQVLDLAKKNLTTSVTALKRLQLLANALSQLEVLVEAKSYAEISQSLAAVKEISSFFRSYMSIPQIMVLFQRIQGLQGQIRSHLDHDFDIFFLQDPNKPISRDIIRDACLTVNTMGSDVRNHFVDRYCSMELKEYRRIFRSTDEAGQLDNIARRFAWFRRQLAHHEEDSSDVFPEDWEVGQQLCARFSEITRDDLKAALTKAAPSLTVALLLESLQTTLDFESAISTKYRLPFVDIVRKSCTASGGQPDKISSVFDAHMGIFIDAQDKALVDMLSSSRGAKSRPSLEESLSDAENPVTVLPSSTELFYFYGQNLEQCTKLSNGKPLFDLYNLHKKWLKIFAEDVLVASMKSKPKTERERRSMDGRSAEIRNACIALNTADYCQSTSLELEEKIKERIQEEYREKITFQAERDLFLSVISTAITVLLRELENASEYALLAMQRLQWGNQDQVSGQSQYATDLVQAVDSAVGLIRDHIQQKKYLRNFYDKASSLLITRFTNSLVKSRPLKETGAEQLLIDLQVLKASLLRFPQSLEGSSLNTSYVRTVTKSTTQLETLLKVVNSPDDPPQGFISNYTLLIGDSSFSNFQKVLDLKGAPRQQQNKLLDTFLTMTSTMTDLEPTSFLSSLDMDPPATAASSVLSPNSSVASLPNLVSGVGGGGVFSGIVTPPLGTGNLFDSSSPRSGSGTGEGKVLSDLRRLVNFAVRREKEKEKEVPKSGSGS
ncbi:Vacuolar protein sorting-associated protein 53 [Tulasnella sp. 419]|nr:Vacuolar protein sorting-associated protein 53 [Tulasnella sp. 419]